MQFTTQEAKLIERLRKEERRWPRTRWIFLLMIVFILAIEGFLSSQVLAMAHGAVHQAVEQSKDMPADFQTFTITQASQEMIFGFALFWPQFLLGLGVVGWLFAVLIRDWHGRVERVLLLRLLDAQQREDHAA